MGPRDCVLLTPSLLYHLKTTVSVIFFALACERIFIETHSIESRCVMGAENILLTGSSVQLSAPKFYRQGQ